jgi:hypothetical protein
MIRTNLDQEEADRFDDALEGEGDESVDMIERSRRLIAMGGEVTLNA